MIKTLMLIAGWALDHLLGDPSWLPHPVVGFGKLIAWGERWLNKEQSSSVNGQWSMVNGQFLKGGILAVVLILFAYAIGWVLPRYLDFIIVFFCLAGTTLVREVQQVFKALDESLEKGRSQVARIVGRDTSELSAQEVRTAALETLAENLSDGVVAPLFWYILLGAPGMLAYKMVNTLDSMIGYRTDRYRRFGCVAARIDDVANFIPARLTALLLILVGWVVVNTPSLGGGRGRLGGLLSFVWKYGRCHASPNSGWPEAALAGILDCRFGGPHTYFGQTFDKPYIGTNPRLLTTQDMHRSVRIFLFAEILMVLISLAVSYWW